MIDKNHKYSTIQFFWKNKRSTDYCTLHWRTYEEALEVAKGFGYVEPKWYKPHSWGNWMLVTK